MRGMSSPDRMPGAELGFEGGAAAASPPRAKRVARALRLARVGASYAYFGIGVWLLGAVVMPLVALPARLRGLPEAEVTRRTQRATHWFFRSFIAFMTDVMRVGRLEWVNAEALAGGPRLIVANHPSLIDTPVLGTRLPQADFIVGADWMKNAFMRRAIRGAGYFEAEDGAAIVQLAVERLRAGRTVVVYPEGSRSPLDGLRPFQRGAAHIALEAGCDILPVVLHVTPRVLTKEQSWTSYPLENPRWRVEVGEPIRTPVDDGAMGRPLAARRLTGVLEDHFKKRCARGRH
jgi:1-acyl-sn-glycerol-3-phosphate acyltransferase